MNDSLPPDLRGATEFEVTEEHLAMLRRTHITYDHWLEFGAPVVDPKRPYGTSDVYWSIAEILGVKPIKIDGEPEFSDEQRRKMMRLHHEMTIVIQILVVNLRIDVGLYRRSSPYHALQWVPATD